MLDMSDEQKMLGELMGKMIQRFVEKVSNELVYDNKELTDPEVTMTFNACFQDFSFIFMKSLNLVLNGADAEKMGNVNEFITLLEAKYNQSEELRKEVMEE